MGLELGFAFKSTSTLSDIVTLGARRHTVVTVASLILIPICAREIHWGFLAAMILGGITFVITSISVLEMLITRPSGYESQLFGPVVWIIFQIPIILFGYRGRKELSKAIDGRD
jgi:hypothetical protein